MAVYTPYPTRPESVFDLEHIGELSVNRTIPLLVSPQVLYALQNVALAEVADLNRYAVSLADNGYYRLQEADADEYAAFLEIVSQTGLQLSDYLLMSTPLNYKAPLLGIASNLNAAAGQNNISIGGPGSDEVFVVENVRMTNQNHAMTFAEIFVTDGSASTVILFQLSPAGAAEIIGNGAWHVGPGQSLIAAFGGCTAGDDLYFAISGYIMELVV